MIKNKKIQVEGKEVSILFDNEKEYISLTGYAESEGGRFFYF
jgi:hypothetical protein